MNHAQGASKQTWLTLEGYEYVIVGYILGGSKYTIFVMGYLHHFLPDRRIFDTAL